MKYFTHPEGKFIIKIPVEWQYKNVVAGYEEKSPFSFELYEGNVGCFQVSCYEIEKAEKSNIDIQSFDTNNLDFILKRMDGNGFNVHIWFVAAGDHIFMAKYIYDTKKSKSKNILTELKKAEDSLKTLQLLNPNSRQKAIDIDKYEKFMASLAASFDLLDDAFNSKSVISVVLIIANQIDAYLRLSLVMVKQLNDETNDIDISFLHQGEKDRPISERKIYSLAKKENIIETELFEKLENLYKTRNKMVHRYIISDFRTREISDLSIGYIEICEEVRLILQNIENRQFAEKIGIYGGSRNPQDEHSAETINFLYSQINDKHLIKKRSRKITISRN